MTLLRGPTIPSEFIKLDTNITDADRFANVRDQQVLRENHNILLARRTLTPLVSQVFRETGDNWSITGQTFKHYLGAFSEQNPQGAVLAEWEVEVPPFVVELQFIIRAYVTDGSGDADIWPYAGNLVHVDDQIEVTATAGAGTRKGTIYTHNLPLPSWSNRAYRTKIGLMYGCGAFDGAQEDPATVAWAGHVASGVGHPGEGYVVATGAVASIPNTSVGDILYFTSPANTIEPRTITYIENTTVDGSTYARLWVDSRWTTLPQQGDTFNTEGVEELVVEDVTVRPVAITDFYEQPGVY